MGRQVVEENYQNYQSGHVCDRQNDVRGKGCLVWLKSGLWIRINFLRIRIRIQSLMLEANPDPDPIRIQGFNDQKLKKNYS
jgi:hypothetical protein